MATQTGLPLWQQGGVGGLKGPRDRGGGVLDWGSLLAPLLLPLLSLVSGLHVLVL